MLESVRQILSDPWFLVLWAALVLPSVAWVIHDLRTRNAHLVSLMKVVWAFTVIYSGPLGLLIFRLTGRKEIPADGLWRHSITLAGLVPGAVVGARSGATCGHAPQFAISEYRRYFAAC